MLLATFIQVYPSNSRGDMLWRREWVVPLTACWPLFGPLTHKELLIWLFSNCSPLLSLLFPMQFLYICLLICFSSILSFCMNIRVFIPVVFSLTFHRCLHCPSLCWTHLHVCKEWERNSTLQFPICSSHCTGVKDKIWDFQELGLAQAIQALNYACNLRFRKHWKPSIFMLCNCAMGWNSTKSYFDPQSLLISVL